MKNRTTPAWKQLCTLFVAICSALPAVAQRYQLNQYNLKDGLPQSQVTALLQDHRGALWVGTQGGGLAKFNGVDFTVINTGDGLPGNQILSLIQEGDRLLVGTDNGLCSFDGREVQSDTIASHHLRIEALLHDENRLFIATNQGLFLQEDLRVNGAWIPLVPEEGFFDVCIHQNRLYASSDKGVYTWDEQLKNMRLLRFGGTTYCNNFFSSFNNELLVGTYGK